MNVVADEVIKCFQREIHDKGSGRHEWRDNAGKEFKILSEKMSQEVMEMGLGIRDGIETEAWSSFYAAQIMVALYGNHGPLFTKPGEITFHNHMESLDESRASGVWPLPKGFNWKGANLNEIMQNCFDIAETNFANGLQKIFDSIDFSQFLIVSG